MFFVNTIKNYFYQSSIKEAAKVLNKISREMINLNAAKSIGILYDASTASNIMAVTQFADKLKALDKEVYILAYVNNHVKENLNPVFFNKTDVNWANIPHGDKITTFQKRNLDILITALTKECLPIEYLAATSKAKFRVGSFSKNKINFYELMINTKENQQLEYLIQQIFHFLNVINKN